MMSILWMNGLIDPGGSGNDQFKFHPFFVSPDSWHSYKDIKVFRGKCNDQ